MMKLEGLFAVLLAFALLAGCASQPAPQAPAADSTSPSMDDGGSDAVSIMVLSPPTTAAAGQPITFTWKVEAQEQPTPHTSVHLGYASVPSDPTPAKYASSTQYIEGTVPGEFSSAFTPEFGGTLYYRAHVVVAGAHYWTDEMTIAVSGPDAFADEAELEQSMNDSVNDLDALQ